jgi:NADPH-dependent F420 reductase
VVVAATPWEAAEATLSGLAEQLRGKVVVSMANALARMGRQMVAVVPPRGSMAETVQAILPSSFVSGAFHHLPAGHLMELERALDSDVLVTSDHEQAIQVTCDLIEMMPRLRPLIVGSLAHAAAVESFTAVLVGVNKRYSCSASIRLSGIDEDG